MSAAAEVTNLRDADAQACRKAIAQGELVLVDFWAEWCGPCRSLKPVLADLAGRRPELTILKVDVERNGEFADEFAVQGVPALLLFKDGTCVDRRFGKVPFVEIDRMIGRHS
jgi:thioredoxin 1